MPSSFDNIKSLRFVITLASGSFTSASAQVDDNGNLTHTSLGNTVTLEGYRATVDIDRAGGAMYGHLHCQIYGISQSTMNSVTSFIYQPQDQPRNTISVFAIDGAQETLVFYGDITTAWSVYQQMPDVFLQIQAIGGYINKLTPIPPTSYQGSVDAATVMAQLASQMGYVFENNGVSVQLSNPYLPGTAMDQATELAEQAGIALYLDNNILAITPLNQPRNTTNIPQISAQSGLEGFVTFDGRSVNLKTLFNPAIRFGGQIQVVTDTPPGAAGQWYVASVAHSLSSEKPGGPWFSQVSGLKIQLAATS